MLPWGLGIERGRSPSTARRWVVRAIGAVAVLLVAALPAAPTRAADTVGIVPSATADSPPPIPVDATAQSNSATNTQTATATGGAGGDATGGTAGPTQGAGGDSRGGDAYANGGSAQAHNSLENQQLSQTSGRDRPAHGGNGSTWGAEDTYDDIAAAKPRKSRHAARRIRRSPAHSGSRTGDGANESQAGRNGGHHTGTASSTGSVPGHGNLPPDRQHPFFSLLSAAGGAGGGMTLLLLAVLGAAIALSNRDFRAFRTPAAQWRPPAYVPPIELPG